MANVNAYPYIRDFEKFRGNIHQKTLPTGHTQSYWYVMGQAIVGDSMASCNNVTIYARQLMGNSDDVITFNVTCTTDNGIKVIIPFAISLSKQQTIPITVLENQSGHFNNNDWVTGDDITQIRTISTTRLSSVLLRIITLTTEQRDFYDNYAGVSTAIIPYTINGNLYFNASINSTPTFAYDDLDSIRNYIETGDRTGAIKDYSVDWTIYTSEGLTPPVKIVWRSFAIEQGINSGIIDGDNLYITVFAKLGNDITVIETVPYNNGNISTNFLTVCQISNPALANGILSNSPVTTKRGTCTMRFRLDVYEDTNSIGYVNLSNIVHEGGHSDYGFDVLIDMSTITVITGTGDDNDGYHPPYTDSDIIGGETDTTDGYNYDGNMCTPYAITTNDLRILASKLWTGDFNKTIFNINLSPLDNIISCKCLPTKFSGNKHLIVIGNYDTDILGDKLKNVYTITVGTLKIQPYYNSFLDYAPYTNLSIYLPFIGFKTLDPSIMDKTIKVKYIIDVICGACKAAIFIDDIYYISYDGQCGIDLPLSASNRAQVESSYINGALGAIGELATGDIGGAINQTISAAMTPYHYNTQGSYSPACASVETKNVYVIIDRPVAQYPTNYGHLIGYPCHLTRNLSTLKGFTKCGGDIDLQSCAASETEKEMIKQALIDGVYL